LNFFLVDWILLLKHSRIERKTSTAYLPNFFERDPNLSFVNTWRPKPQTIYEKNTGSVDDFWQQVANFGFNVSNLLFSQVSLLQADTDKQW